MWFKILILFILFVAFATFLTLYVGEKRWKSTSIDLLSQLTHSQVPLEIKQYDPAEIAELPTPVRRYFETVLPPGQSVISAVQVTHNGTFNMAKLPGFCPKAGRRTGGDILIMQNMNTPNNGGLLKCTRIFHENEFHLF